ncbi:MAG: DNA-3-methyladenine glycosylase 2 family protein [Clostridia bacterium]|nr:DNA-3-methyladenine glycosylase 2 family protein [Clostridia bacterium]
MIEVFENKTVLTGDSAFSPEQTFLCGQCFRFDPDGEGFSGIAGGKFIRAEEKEGVTTLFCPAEDFESFWKGYFDLDRDYSAVRPLIAGDPFLCEAEKFGRGIRLLRQEPWEALCSFIISQCNNIPRIKGIVSRLCQMYGAEVEGGYAFPGAETLSGLEVSDLAPLRAGYRADYIINAARAVASGELDLQAVAGLPTDAARRELMALRGIGKKVADCVLLFGLGKTDAFPVDVWIKKVLNTVYPGGLDVSVYGDMAGLVQQYVFFYARENGDMFVK